jgi:hypothetical protein
MLEANSRSMLNRPALIQPNKALNEAEANYIKSSVNGLEAAIEATTFMRGRGMVNFVEA